MLRRLSALTLGLMGMTAHHAVQAIRFGVEPVRITHAALVRWTRVAICEEGGWHNVDGPTYFGSLGWTWATWQQFRRADFPKNAYHATVAQQVWAAQRFAGHYGFVPDRFGCYSY